jgi:hypothetical protein
VTLSFNGGPALSLNGSGFGQFLVYNSDSVSSLKFGTHAAAQSAAYDTYLDMGVQANAGAGNQVNPNEVPFPTSLTSGFLLHYGSLLGTTVSVSWWNPGKPDEL